MFNLALNKNDLVTDLGIVGQTDMNNVPASVLPISYMCTF